MPTKLTKKNEQMRVYMDSSILEGAKNTDGVAGKKCNNCGGFGFTMGLQGNKLDCKYCDKTGVELPTIRELQDQISDLKKDLHMLRKALIETLSSRGIVIKTNIEA